MTDESDHFEEFDALVISKVTSVHLTERNGAAIHITTDDGDPVLLLLDQPEAVRLSELLLAYGPPAPDEAVQLEFSSGAEAEVDVDEVLVDSRGQSQRPFQVSFRVGGDNTFTMHLAHREVVRWHRRLGEEIAGYIKRRTN
jgi:hypothetical protein